MKLVVEKNVMCQKIIVNHTCLYSPDDVLIVQNIYIEIL